MQNRRKLPFAGLCSGYRKPTFSAGLHPVTLLVGQSGLLRSKPCLCVQLGLFGIFHSLLLEAGPGAKHLVTKTKTSRGKAHTVILSCQYLPISWSDCLNGSSKMFFHCCFWMSTFDLLSTNFFWRVLQRRALWFIFVQISWICSRDFFFFVCLLVFPQKVAGSSRNNLMQRMLLWPDTEHTNDQTADLQKHPVAWKSHAGGKQQALLDHSLQIFD